MTQAQQDAVVAAQQKFFAAEAANTAAQSASQQAEAAVEAAKTNATVTAPAQAQALVKSANDAYFADVANQQTVIQQAQQAQAALGQAQIDLQTAITASLQTGAVEMMPAPVKQF
jgi:hypothetical protein